MNAERKSNYDIRGRSKIPMLIVIGIVTVTLVGAFVFSKSSNSTKQEVTSDSFRKVEGSSYIFYYPDVYLKSNDTPNVEQVYKNPNSQAVSPEELLLIVQPRTQNLPAPTYEYCLKTAQSMREKGDDQITAEIAHGGFGDGNGIGCKYIYKSKVADDINDSVVIVGKDLWYPEGEDKSAYRARTIYFENAGKAEAKTLNHAIDQFTLK